MKDKEYIVYRHVCPNGKIYIGVTCNVKERWKPSRYKRNNTPFKDAIIEFGWKNIKHEILYSNLTRDEALNIEGELIEKTRVNGNSLNANRSGNYQKSEAFREENKAYQKTWREANPNYQKIYREEHREEYNTNHREWRKRKKGGNKGGNKGGKKGRNKGRNKGLF